MTHDEELERVGLDPIPAAEVTALFRYSDGKIRVVSLGKTYEFSASRDALVILLGDVAQAAG